MHQYKAIAQSKKRNFFIFALGSALKFTNPFFNFIPTLL